MARKGGVPANRVLNCRWLDEITQFFRKRKTLQTRSMKVSNFSRFAERQIEWRPGL
jgi:hypothetical protein